MAVPTRSSWRAPPRDAKRHHGATTGARADPERSPEQIHHAASAGQAEPGTPTASASAERRNLEGRGEAGASILDDQFDGVTIRNRTEVHWLPGWRMSCRIFRDVRDGACQPPIRPQIPCGRIGGDDHIAAMRPTHASCHVIEHVSQPLIPTIADLLHGVAADREDVVGDHLQPLALSFDRGMCRRPRCRQLRPDETVGG
jgi:hypothetical protein